MCFGLIQFDAMPGDAAYAADLRHRAGLSIAGGAARTFTVSAVRPAPAMVNAAETREQARREVMAERGVDMLSMFRMPAQQRIRAEAEIRVETARRTAPAPIRAAGTVLDIRI